MEDMVVVFLFKSFIKKKNFLLRKIKIFCHYLTIIGGGVGGHGAICRQTMGGWGCVGACTSVIKIQFIFNKK